MNWQLSVGKSWRRKGWLLVVVLTAVFLRFYLLSDVPPGLTHDEADHGITAWQIVNGAREIYFTVGYGREPLYDYATALLMAVTGPTYLAGRVTAVFFSLLMLVGTYLWTRRAFDTPTALLTAAGLAVAFWPLMAARQALRSITLPALFVLALILFWHGLRVAGGGWRVADYRLPITDYGLRNALLHFLAAGFLLGLTFYTYIPARGMWLLFPALALYVTLADRRQWQDAWRGTAVSLLIALLVGLPLFIYLWQNPTAEVRITELSGPLVALRDGDWRPLWQNVVGSLRLFTVEGDPTWRYNVAGRPLLNPLLGALFYTGVLMAGWQAIRPFRGGDAWRGAAAFAALGWLALGFAPVLITGPELSMTQAMGVQPVVYLFPALAAVKLGNWVIGHWVILRRFAWVGAVVVYGATAVLTVRAYFEVWVNAPQVRVQYESTMAAAMDYLNVHQPDAAAVSTITPGPFHTPALAQMTLHGETVTPGWFDGRGALLLPDAADGVIIFPGFAPLHPALARYFETAVLQETLPLRPSDLDRPLTVYRLDGAAARDNVIGHFAQETAAGVTLPVMVSDAAQLLGYDLLTPQVPPGGVVQVATLWQAQRPLPAEARIFVHVLGPDGVPFAHQDTLHVPAQGWRLGDLFIQLHEFTIPPETAVGDYPLVIGLYTCADGCENGRRLPILADGDVIGDNLMLVWLPVQ